MIHTVTMEDLDDADPVGGCGCEGLTFADVIEIDGCSLTPGDPSPAGRCPHCEALVYPLPALS